MMMDAIHDYEYYEARAKDVKLEDITSDEYNADILAGLRDNDAELKHISITDSAIGRKDFDVCEGNHWGWLGYFASWKHSTLTASHRIASI